MSLTPPVACWALPVPRSRVHRRPPRPLDAPQRFQGTGSAPSLTGKDSKGGKGGKGGKGKDAARGSKSTKLCDVSVVGALGGLQRRPPRKRRVSRPGTRMRSPATPPVSAAPAAPAAHEQAAAVLERWQATADERAMQAGSQVTSHESIVADQRPPRLWC